MSLLYPLPSGTGTTHIRRVPHGQESRIASVIDNGTGDVDSEMAIVVAQLAMQDIEDVIASRRADIIRADKNALNSPDTPPTDDIFVLEMQLDSFRNWLSIAQDAVYARGLAGVLPAALPVIETQRPAQLLQLGRPLPAQTGEQIIMVPVLYNPEPVRVTLEPKIFDLGKGKNNQLDYPDFLVESVPVLTDPEPVQVPLEPKIFDLGKGKNNQIDYPDFLTESVLTFHTEIGEMISDFASVVGRESERKETPPPAGPSVLATRMVQCLACTDELRFDKALHTVCDHYYCPACVSILCTTRDAEVFPPRCCLAPIPVADIIPFLAPDKQETFTKRHTEFSVPANERLYCANNTCSQFLGSRADITEQSVACTACAHKTCPRCRLNAHANPNCDAEAEGQLRALAAQQQWRACPGCNVIIQRNEGCPHMSCILCVTQFCYTCGAVWKTCACAR